MEFQMWDKTICKNISRKYRTHILYTRILPSSVAIATDTIILFVVSEEDDYEVEELSVSSFVRSYGRHIVVTLNPEGNSCHFTCDSI